MKVMLIGWNLNLTLQEKRKKSWKYENENAQDVQILGYLCLLSTLLINFGEDKNITSSSSRFTANARGPIQRRLQKQKPHNEGDPRNEIAIKNERLRLKSIGQSSSQKDAMRNLSRRKSTLQNSFRDNDELPKNSRWLSKEPDYSLSLTERFSYGVLGFTLLFIVMLLRSC